MTLLRLILLGALGLFLVAGFVYVGIQPGQIAYTGGQVDIILKPIMAAALVLIATLVMMLVWGFAGWLWTLPARVRRNRQEAALRRGLEALGLSMAAMDSGDNDEARRQSQKALGLLPDAGAAKLLAAQAALQVGDAGAAETLFGALSDMTGYGIAGRRGLAEIALSRGNESAAIAHAQAALALSKKSPWPAEFVMQRRIATADWDGALAALDDGEKRGLVDAKTSARRRSVLLTAAAHHAERMMEPAKALELALRAVKIAPAFAPAAVMAARLQAYIGKNWQAAGTLESAWEANPHPALALAYKDLKAGEDPSARGRWLDGLIRLNPNHRESRILGVEQALTKGDTDTAIALLDPLLADRPTSRLLALRASAAKACGDDAGARAWLGKGVGAPREADWSDLDPDGSAFAYQDSDWMRLVTSFGDHGVLVHPRHERSEAERLVAPELLSLTEDEAKASIAGLEGQNAPLSPDDPGLAAFDGLGESDNGAPPRKSSWLSF
ncbi:MAG: hypothetical protein RLZZ157_437 [Pseudomonadota bacterium]|jgi:HemY protein